MKWLVFGPRVDTIIRHTELTAHERHLSVLWRNSGKSAPDGTALVIEEIREGRDPLTRLHLCATVNENVL